jgi:hypothetical protein
MSNPSKDDVTFTYVTANGTARENDYGAGSRTGRIPASATSTRVFVPITGDNRKEVTRPFLSSSRISVTAGRATQPAW